MNVDSFLTSQRPVLLLERPIIVCYIRGGGELLFIISVVRNTNALCCQNTDLVVLIRTVDIQGDTKRRELLKCVVAAMYS
jgi:hypothetical protein